MDDLHVICENGHWAVTGNHENPGFALECPPGEGCCEIPHSHGTGCLPDCRQAIHDHDLAASSCPGQHPGQPCPSPENCPVYAGGFVTSSEIADDFSGPMTKGTCPGGHCGSGVAGCTVCRPVIITALPGLIGSLQPAGRT